MPERSALGGLVALVLGSFAVVMSATTINVAIAPMMVEYSISHSLAQGFSSVFLGMTVVCAPLTSWLADRFGAWRVFVRLLLLYALASLLAGVSDSFGSMLVVRGVQGICAGIIQPLSMFLVLETAHPDRQGRTLSLFSLGVVLAPGLGPTLAGFVVELTDWRYTFWLGLPPALLSLWLVYLFKPQDAVKSRAAAAPDLVGLALLAVLVGLVFLWPFLLVVSLLLALLVAALWGLLCVLFWQQLKRRDAPLVSPDLLSHRAYFYGLLVTLAYGVGMYGSIFLVPLMLQKGMGVSALTTGNLLLLGGVALVISIPLSGRLVDRFSPQLVVLIGLVCFALSCFLLAWPGGLIIVGVGVVLSRVALGMIIPGLYTGMARAVSADSLRAGTALTTMTRQAGGAFGITMIGVLLGVLDRVLVVPGLSYRILFLVLGLLFLLSLFAAVGMGRFSSGAQ